VLITGPYMATEDVDRLRRHPAAAWVPVIQMVDDMPSYLAAADAAVCMGGYNTTCEVLALAVPAVIIPRVQPRAEQRMRAERLGARGLVRWIHPDGLSARVLAENIERVAALPRVDLVARVASIAHRGVRTAARQLEALLPAARSVDASERAGSTSEVASALR
jgi:predicted glycosyltransferase